MDVSTFVKQLMIKSPPILKSSEIITLHQLAANSMNEIIIEPLTAKDVGTFVIIWTSDDFSSALPICFIHAFSEYDRIVVLTQHWNGEILILSLDHVFKSVKLSERKLEPVCEEIIFFGNFQLVNHLPYDKKKILFGKRIGTRSGGYLYELWINNIVWIYFKEQNGYDLPVPENLYPEISDIRFAYETHMEKMHALLPGDRVVIPDLHNFPDIFVSADIIHSQDVYIIDTLLFPMDIERTYSHFHLTLKRIPEDTEQKYPMLAGFQQVIPIDQPKTKPFWSIQMIKQIAESFGENPPSDVKFIVRETVGGKKSLLDLGKYGDMKLVAEKLINYYQVSADFPN
jgi:hypothetical protein